MHFLEQVVMDVMGLFIPNVKVIFLQLSKVVKNFYYNPCPCGQAKEGKFAPMVHVTLSSWDLDVQQGMFKLNMKKCSSNHGKSHGP